MDTITVLIRRLLLWLGIVYVERPPHVCGPACHHPRIPSPEDDSGREVREGGWPVSAEWAKRKGL